MTSSTIRPYGIAVYPPDVKFPGECVEIILMLSPSASEKIDEINALVRKLGRGYCKRVAPRGNALDIIQTVWVPSSTRAGILAQRLAYHGRTELQIPVEIAKGPKRKLPPKVA